MLNFVIGFTTGVIVSILIAASLAVFASRIRRKARQEQERKKLLARLRYANNPQVPLRSQARSIIRSIVVKEKEAASYGFSIADVINTLQGRFDEAMHFGNYGSVWEIDHIQPLKNFDLTDGLQFMRAIHPSNLQPLFRGENQSKGAK